MKIGAPLVEFAEGAEQDTGTVVGELGTSEHPPAADAPAAPPTGQPQVFPAVRALARKLDVDLEAVDATGPGGSITRADVERAAKSISRTGPAEPLRGLRRAMAERMTAAHAEIVPATVTDDADIDDWRKGEDVTIRLVRAIATACKAEPALNAWYHSDAGERRLIERVDIGIELIPGAASSFLSCAMSQSATYRTYEPGLTGCGLTQSRAQYPRESCAVRRLRYRISDDRRPVAS